MFTVARADKHQDETEQEYPPGKHAVSRYGYLLRSNGRVLDRVGLSAVVSEQASIRERTVHIKMPFAELVSNLQTACGLTLDDEVYCWGHNVSGLLGIGNVTLQECGFLLGPKMSPLRPEDHVCTDTPQRVPLRGRARHLSGDHRRTICVTLQDGSVWWWGEMPDGANASVPRRVPGVSDAVSSSCGARFACALGRTGAVKCWGQNEFGQLGNGSTDDAAAASAVVGLSGVSELAAGTAHVCAVTEDRALYCWGKNGFGQLGDGTFEDRHSPVQVQPPGTVAPEWGENGSARPQDNGNAG